MTTRKHDPGPGERHPERRRGGEGDDAERRSGGEGDDYLVTPEWLLERIALARAAGSPGDRGGAADPLAPHDRDAALARLAADPDGEDRLAALARSTAEILSAHPPARVAAEIERRLHLSRAASRERADAGALSGWRTRWLRWGLPVAGACAAALAVIAVLGVGAGDEQVVVREVSERRTADAGPRTRLKGVTAEPRLIVYRHRDDRRDRAGGDADSAEVLDDGAAVSAGDLLQLAYAARGYRYGVIVSIDGRGAVTLHFPENPDAEPALSPDGHALLAHAYELDDAPAFERFVLAASREPIAVDDVIRAAEAVAGALVDAADPDASGARHQPLALPDSAVQHSTLLRKVDVHAP